MTIAVDMERKATKTKKKLYALHHEKNVFTHVTMTQMLISTFISTFITDNTSVSYTPLYPTFIYLTSA